MRDAVRNDIADMEIIQLTREEPERFAAALNDTPALSPAMRRAFEHHRRLVRPE